VLRLRIDGTQVVNDNIVLCLLMSNRSGSGDTKEQVLGASAHACLRGVIKMRENIIHAKLTPMRTGG